MEIDFYKCESNLNDFVLIEENNIKSLRKNKLSNIAQILTNRRASVGGDGLIIFSKKDNKIFKIYVINKDGTFPEMCINGLFSAVAFAKNIYGFIDGVIYYNDAPFTYLYSKESNLFKMEFPLPSLNPKGFVKTKKKKFLNEKINTPVGMISIYFVSAGNPHIIVFCDNAETMNIEPVGKFIENNKIFINKTNVEFVTIKSSTTLYARFWERGVGETKSCGSGTLALSYISFYLGFISKNATIYSKGGSCNLSIGDKITMEQRANVVFTGSARVQ